MFPQVSVNTLSWGYIEVRPPGGLMSHYIVSPTLRILFDFSPTLAPLMWCLILHRPLAGMAGRVVKVFRVLRVLKAVRVARG